MPRRIGGIVAALTVLLLVQSVGVGSGPQSPAFGPSAASASPVQSAVLTASDRGLKPFKVRATDLGMHSNKVKPDAPLGSLRLDCWPGWRQSNPSRGVYDWTYLDSAVEQAREWGYRDIQLPFCGTPEWAAGSIKDPAAEVLGYKTTAPPRSLADWKAFVAAVVKRYKGTITSYQVWNEATWPQFFQGSPRQMAKMTRLLSQVVDRFDPGAEVVSASVQMFNSDVRRWSFKYLKTLRAFGWPVDVFAVHGYGSTGSLTKGRQSVISSFRGQLVSLGAPSRPIWDSELTYKSTKRLSGRTQGALVIRSHLDAWRMGVRRTYWYRWTDTFNPFGAVQMQSGTAAAKALQQFSTRVIGTKYRGCTESSNGLVRCSFTQRGKYFTIMWAERSAVRVYRNRSTKYQNLVTGKWARARVIKVTAVPVLIKARV